MSSSLSHHFIKQVVELAELYGIGGGDYEWVVESLLVTKSQSFVIYITLCRNQWGLHKRRCT